MAHQGDCSLDIVVADGNRIHRDELCAQLKAFGHCARPVTTCVAVIEAVAGQEPDVVLMEYRLPDGDATEVCHQVRAASDVPIIIVSGHDGHEAKISALDYGADDYVTKPYSTEELLARVRAVIRRKRPRLQVDSMTCSELRFDFATSRLFFGEERIPLTKTEWKIVAYLAGRPRQSVPSGMIIANVWGPNSGTNMQVLRVHISNIRRKLERGGADPFVIATEQGVGFRLDADCAPDGEEPADM